MLPVTNEMTEMPAFDFFVAASALAWFWKHPTMAQLMGRWPLFHYIALHRSSKQADENY
jgi:hypothetical protein